MKAIRISIKPKRPLSIPLAHYNFLQGVFYKLLSYDPDLSAEVHSTDPDQSWQYKYCCFSGLSGKYELHGKERTYKDVVEWEIRSMDDRIPETIAAGLMQQRHLTIAESDCIVTSIEERRTHYLSDRVRIIMDTPIVVYKTDPDNYVHYYSPQQEEFRVFVMNNLRRKYQRYYKTEEVPRFGFRTVHSRPKDKCVTKYKGIYISGYYGLYELEAPPEIVELAYYAGIGSKNTQGFGTIKKIIEV